MQGVLFDLDDTLIDHRGAARDALVGWATAAGDRRAPAELEATWIALETEHYRRFQAGELTKEQQRRARVRAFFADHDLDDDAAADARFGGYWTAYVEAWRPFPDALPAVRRARAAGLAVGILTNGDARDQRAKVVATGLAAEGVPVFASSELPAAKPDPRAFTTACAGLGVEPGACLMVGDSWESDVVGARRAGLPLVLLDRYGRRPDADVRRIASLDELAFSPV